MATVAVPLDIAGARVDPTNTPEYAYIAGTNFPSDGYAFPSAGSKAIYIKIGAELYGNSGNWTLELHWYSRSGSTSGNVQWVAALAAITPGDAQSVETKAFATSQNTTTTVNSTAKGLTLTQITVSNLDSVNAGDTVWLKITRGTDTMTGDALLARGSASYSDGNSGTAGSGDVVGPASATTTALARYNGTTGKLIQNSAVSLDNSGNFTSVGTINAAAVDQHLVSDGTNMQPKFFKLTQLTADSSAIGTTLTAVISVSIPAAGTYWFDFNMDCFNSTATGNTLTMDINYSGTVTRIAYTLEIQTAAAAMSMSAANANSTALISATSVLTSERIQRARGTLTCSTSGTLAVRISRQTSGNVTARAGSSALVIQQ